jgi:hypothetical protein
MYRGLRKSVKVPGLLEMRSVAGAIGDSICESKPETQPTYPITALRTMFVLAWVHDRKPCFTNLAEVRLQTAFACAQGMGVFSKRQALPLRRALRRVNLIWGLRAYMQQAWSVLQEKPAIGTGNYR